MNYEVHIRDVEALEEPMILEHAERASIVTNWLGSDDKTQPIVGSELVFTMETPNGEDGRYIQFFTNDEQKWLVEHKVSTEQVSEEAAESAGNLLWKGYILPESYSEPWESPLFYVGLSAVDGLGLLKGKELPADFYEEEKTVIEVLTACLSLTGLDYDLYLAPAIEHANVKGWHNYFMDTRKYYDPEQLPKAYEILENVVHSMRCQLYQCDGRWELIGINKRHLLNVACYHYAATGELLGTVTLTRVVKQPDWSPSPLISMVPSIREVVVTHDTEDIQLREDTFQEQDIDWTRAPGVTLEVYPDAWDYDQDYMPVMKGPEYFLELPAVAASEATALSLTLKEKPYIREGWKVKLDISLKVTEIPTTDNTEFSTPLWFRILQNGQVVADSLWGQLNPELSITIPLNGEGTGSFEFVAEEDGFLDILIHPPFHPEVEAVRVTNLSIDVSGYDETATFILPVDPKSSVVREIDLAISDDISGFSHCFYLEKQREFSTTDYYKVEVPILYSFSQNGNNYAVVSLKHAHLANQFLDFIHYTNRWIYLQDLEVIYNLNGGEQMVIKTENLLTGSLYVTVRPYKPQTGNRLDWLKWVDAAYGVEVKPYAEIVADIESKLFATPHLRIEAVAQAPVKFNDIIKFPYRGEDKYFIVANCSWNSDENETSLVLVEGVYAGNSLGNIPPFISAGPDIFISEGETAAQITEAVATDPDGSIASLHWEHIEGEASPVISTAGTLNPFISNLSGPVNTFRLTGTDNQGATASDTMQIFLVGDYQLILTAVEVVEDIPSVIETSAWITKRTKYKISTQPALPEGETVTLIFEARLYRNLANAPRTSAYSGRILITKQGVEIYDFNRTYQTREQEVLDEKTYNTVNYISTDEMFLTIETMLIVNTDSPEDTVSASVNFVDANFNIATAELSNLPKEEELEITLSDHL